MFRTNPEYVHEFDMLIEYQDTLESVEESINSAYINSINAERKVKYAAMFENKDDQYIIEETKQNLFARIGEGIKKLIQKLATMIKNLFGGGKDKEFKDNLSSAQVAIESNPTLKNELIQGITDGRYEIKDVTNFTKAYEEASKLLADGKIDPKTYKGKIELALRKYNTKPLKVIRVENMLAAVSIGGLVFKFINESRDRKGKVSDAVSRAYNRFHKMQGTTDENGEYNTRLAAFWEASRTLMDANADETNQNNKFINFLNDIYKKISRKSNSDRANDAQRHLNKAHKGDKNWNEVQKIRKEISNINNNLTKETNSDEIVKLQNRKKVLEDRLYEIDRDIDPIEKLNRKADADSNKQNSEHARRSKNLDDKESRLHDKENELRNKEKTLHNKEESIKRQIKRVKDDYKTLSNWSHKNKSLDDIVGRSEQLMRVIGIMNNDINRAERELVSLNNEVETLRQRSPQDPAIQSKVSTINSLENEIKGIKGQVKELQTQRSELLDIISKQRKHHNR